MADSRRTRRISAPVGFPASRGITSTSGVGTHIVDNDRLLNIVRSNDGFSAPERWLTYARQHNFTRVSSHKLSACPDCNGLASKEAGQYVYYSTLMHLNVCTTCGLVYGDTRLDPAVIQAHFERAYKDEQYFIEKRQAIFRQITDCIAGHVRHGGRVLDIGGAKGHLMGALKRQRPDLRVVVNDLSKASCAWAESHYHLETVCGSAADLDERQEKFDVVTLIDVIYYEPRIGELWRRLSELVVDDGIVVIRVPNKLPAILLHQWVMRRVRSRRAREMSTQITYFNPEHLYVFSRKYLTTRLSDIGFRDIRFIPAASLTPSKRWRHVHTAYLHLARAVHLLSFGRIIITSAVVVVARRSRARIGIAS
jgi:2-polyprenyl-3-methyl-5-hydroxy-6-metoxy-1,4-benzoquinol methylase